MADICTVHKPDRQINSDASQLVQLIKDGNPAFNDAYTAYDNDAKQRLKAPSAAYEAATNELFIDMHCQDPADVQLRTPLATQDTAKNLDFHVDLWKVQVGKVLEYLEQQPALTPAIAKAVEQNLAVRIDPVDKNAVPDNFNGRAYVKNLPYRVNLDPNGKLKISGAMQNISDVQK